MGARAIHRALFVVLAAVTGTIVFLPKDSPELVFEGKPISVWLDNGYEDATRMLYEVGPAAAPDVFAKLKREHRWHRYAQLRASLPAPLQRMLPRPRTGSFDAWRAANAFLAIGPRVIPELTRGLQDPSPLVRRASAESLAHFRQRGRDISSASTSLALAVHDADPAVRGAASRAVATSR